AFGIDVEAADGEDARQPLLLEPVEDGLAALGVLLGDHEPRRLVIEPDPRAGAFGQQAAVDADFIIGGDVEGGRADRRAVDRDATVLDPALGITTRTKAGAGDDFCKSVAAGRNG